MQYQLGVTNSMVRHASELLEEEKDRRSIQDATQSGLKAKAGNATRRDGSCGMTGVDIVQSTGNGVVFGDEKSNELVAFGDVENG